MKKKFILVTVIVFIVSALFYLWLPSAVLINKTITVKANINNISRQLLDTNGWKNWLSSAPSYNKKLSFNEIEFTKAKTTDENNLGLQYQFQNKEYSLALMAIPLSLDSVVIEYRTLIKNESLILGKLRNYFLAQRIDGDIKEFLNRFRVFAENPSTFYGFNPRFSKLSDSSMIAIKTITKNWPTQKEIYDKINELELYAKQKNALVTRPPMLNIQRLSNSEYQFMVSLPVNKMLTNYNNIIYKQMLPNGNFLVSDSVIGGTKRIDSLFKSFENYKSDYQLTSPAIPFQSLITNRILEKDSTKWITQFYYPIF